MKSLLTYFLLLIVANCNHSLAKEDLTRFVNPFIGTSGHGHTYPGSTVPFGMVQLSPDTRLTGWDGCSGYYGTDSVIYGFSHTHLSGTGCSDYGDILIMPISAKLNSYYKFDNWEYSSGFDKKTETAKAGYYSVYLKRNEVQVELTATKRTGIHKYTFPENKEARVLIDLKHRDDVLDSKLELIGDTMIVGYRRSRAWATDQQVFFAVKFSKPFYKYVIAEYDSNLSNDLRNLFAKNLKGYFVFDDTKELYVRVALSGVSIQGAIKNLAAESLPFTFEEILEKAQNEWNKELSRITIKTNDTDKKTIFYTALYHTFVVPNIYSDVDGYYRGRDKMIHPADGFDFYTVFSLWDTYRAAHPLYTLVQQKRTTDFIKTFINQYIQDGLLPVWELSSNETFCMIGYHAVPVIVDAYMKGIRDYDVETAYKAIKHSAETNLYGLPFYKSFNFIPSDNENESVSKTLEYAYDDWCIAQMAKSLGKMDDYTTFTKRAQSYKNLFDNKTGFLRARYNGGWYTPFDPTEVNNNYTEANCWQYNFYVPHDLTNYMDMLGGQDKFAAKLDELFTTADKLSGRDQSDITGLIGQYAHGNEPSHQIAYLYNYSGKPWHTQKYVRKILDEFYNNSGDGLIGNEDCGQMSAWYVLSAMGFYPVCPGNTEYSIGTPIFDEATLHLENGKKFSITTKNQSKSNIYIQSAKLNGVNYTRSYIKHEDILKGGKLEFVMGDKPNETWGSSATDVPRTSVIEFSPNNKLRMNFDSNRIPIAPLINSEKRAFRKSQVVRIESLVSEEDIFYTIDGNEPNTSSQNYTGPFTIDKTTTVKAKTYGYKDSSATITAKYYRLHDERMIKILTPYNKQYTAGGDEGLIDGIRGEKNFRLGGWQGYQGTDFEAIVDLGSIQPVTKLGAGFLQDVGPWIWMPTNVEIYISMDGTEFTKIADIKSDIPSDDIRVITKDFITDFAGKCRFVRIKAKNFGTIPQWHPGAGDKAFIFIDEIIIE